MQYATDCRYFHKIGVPVVTEGNKNLSLVQQFIYLGKFIIYFYFHRFIQFS